MSFQAYLDNIEAKTGKQHTILSGWLKKKVLVTPKQKPA